jgi:predicted RNA-binding Zn-ribbon protein involved in translation (DUF1610 family)
MDKIRDCPDRGPCLNESLIEELQEENIKLRATLEAVEWATGYFCPWCGNYRIIGHAPDCQRQIALGLAKSGEK